MQVARSLFLLGKQRAAIEVYDEALKLQADDADLWLSKGTCAVQLRDFDR
jgi:Bardet-Biedl syndrome 4 protein